ncbi:hypothetical protein ACDQ55_20950 [Chitinophaga sp. 30R24]|uniref:hypothetical protein n=1 Tax=Chitinophaga sp. 30R24 TaxID=3248838 RepID=UPI003B8FDE70
MITSGIKVIEEGSSIDIEGLIFLSNGVELIVNESPRSEDFEYLTSFFKPRKPWRGPSSEELDILFDAPMQFDGNSSVYICRLPEALIDELSIMGIGDLANLQSLTTLISQRSEEFSKISAYIRNVVNFFLKDNGAFKYRGIYFSPPNLETTAYDNNKKLLGLHVDSAYTEGIPDNKPDIMRLCINLGKETRYILFINKSIQHIREMIAEYEMVKELRYSVDDLVAKFFQYYPDYPVVKLRQRPFDFYLMPADNIIHDGSTEGTHHCDITMVFQGHMNDLIP